MRQIFYGLVILLIYICLFAVGQAESKTAKLWDEWMDTWRRYVVYGDQRMGLGIWADGDTDLESVEMKEGESLTTDQVNIRKKLQMHILDDETEVEEPEEGEAYLYVKADQTLYLKKQGAPLIAIDTIESTTDRTTMASWFLDGEPIHPMITLTLSGVTWYHRLQYQS